MRAMIAPACGCCTSSSASERATTAMSAAMPHSIALSACGAASAVVAASPPRSIASSLLMRSLLLLRAAGGGAAGGRALLPHGAELAQRQASVVVLVHLGEAVVPWRVPRFVARDVAVVVTVHRGEVTPGCGRPGRGGIGPRFGVATGLLREHRRGARGGNRQSQHCLQVHRGLHESEREASGPTQSPCRNPENP